MISYLRAAWPFVGMAAWTMVIVSITVLILPKKYTKAPPLKRYRRWVQSQFDILVELSQKGPFYRWGSNISVKICDTCSIFIGERLSVAPSAPPKLFKPQTDSTRAVVKWKCGGFGRFHKQEYILEMQKGPNISSLPSPGSLAPDDAGEWEWIGDTNDQTWKPEIAMKAAQNEEPWTEIYRGPETVYTQQDLEPGMWVSFRVRSFNSHGESENSTELSAFMKQKVETPGDFMHGPNYSWSQTPIEVLCRLQVPNAARAKDVICTLKQKTISVVYDGAVLVKGDLFGDVVKDESHWQIDDENGKKFLLWTIRKATDYQPWASVIKNHPEIDCQTLNGFRG